MTDAERAPAHAGRTLTDAPGAWSRGLQSGLGRFAAAAALVALTLGVAKALVRVADVPDPEMLFLLTVMVAAVTLGRGPAVLAAALGVACYDFFFVPPLNTFTVNDKRYVLTFAMMFAVGLVLSELATRLRRQQHAATARAQRTAALHALDRELAALERPEALADVAARRAATLFGVPAVLVCRDAAGALAPLAAFPADATLDAAALATAELCLQRATLTEAGGHPPLICAPLAAGTAPFGVLALKLTSRATLADEPRALLEPLARQVAHALERARLRREAEQAALRAKTEELRSSLLSAVSHDLRTPLASITGAATTLRDEAALPDETKRELLDAVVDQAERLERLLTNLLDMTRLEAGAVALARDWVPVDELIGAALTWLEPRLTDRPVSVRIAPDVPLVLVDPVVFGQVFINLLENADKYTPAGSPIDVEARRAGEAVEIDVLDRGPGLAPGSEQQVFEKFYRGRHAGVPGVGLGLPICRGIVQAHGGRLAALSRPGGGACFRVTLPQQGTPPAVEAPGGEP